MCQTGHANIPNQAQIRRPLRDPLERKSSYPFHSASDKGIGHTYNEEKQTRSQNAETERSIVGCETVKIRARTPFGFSDTKHIGINWRIILVRETAQMISLPVERSRNPLRFQGNTMRKQTWKALRATDCMDLKDIKRKVLWEHSGCQRKFSPSCMYFNRSTKESKT